MLNQWWGSCPGWLGCGGSQICRRPEVSTTKDAVAVRPVGTGPRSSLRVGGSIRIQGLPVPGGGGVDVPFVAAEALAAAAEALARCLSYARLLSGSLRTS